MSIGSLSAYTSFGIGGPAEIFTLDGHAAIPEAFSGEYVVLGRGSNVLVSDRGVREKVIINRLKVVTFDGETVFAESGASLISLCALCAERGLSGLEWACGVPGSVGGAVVMNAGAYGSCIADSLVSVDVFRNGKIRRLDKSECGLSYRSSGFTSGDFIIGATLKLSRENPEDIASAMRVLQARRKQSQPSGRSAGSVYKRADRPAGWYIEQAGLKGAREGGAAVSDRHANFIINTGGASARDVLTLMLRIEEEVYKRFKVKLEREIKLIGEF